MWIDSVGVAIVGGFLCLDRVFPQALISRPIVAGPVIGAFLSDPYTGLITGAFVELLWIDRIPVGTYIPPNDSVVAILITAGSILAGIGIGHCSQSLFVLAFLLFLPLGPIGKKIEFLIIQSNDNLCCKAVEYAKAGNIRGISRCHIAGLCKFFLMNVFLILVPLLVGSAMLIRIYPILPREMVKALYYIYFILPIIGITVALNTIKLRGTIPVFSGLFLVFTLMLEFF
jgi:PTS system mannose-specific IIC component